MSSPLDQIEHVRNRLASFLVGAFVGVIPFMLYKDIPTENKEIIVYMVGQLSGMATMALGFYFVNKVGQDALDAQKSENTGKLADAITAAAKAGTDSAPAVEGAEQVAAAAEDEAARIRSGETPV
jgi:hypothetical protein